MFAESSRCFVASHTPILTDNFPPNAASPREACARARHRAAAAGEGRRRSFGAVQFPDLENSAEFLAQIGRKLHP